MENPISFRKNVVSKIQPILSGNEVLTINLERSIYNYAIQEATQRKIQKKWTNPQFAHLYIDRLRTIYLNLKNPELVSHLVSGEIPPQTLAFMTHQEMNPERWAAVFEKRNIINANKYNVNAEASTDMFQCPKCKSRKCTYYTLQIRSADEPESIFVSCLECGKNFRKN